MVEEPSSITIQVREWAECNWLKPSQIWMIWCGSIPLMVLSKLTTTILITNDNWFLFFCRLNIYMDQMFVLIRMSSTYRFFILWILSLPAANLESLLPLSLLIRVFHRFFRILPSQLSLLSLYLSLSEAANISQPAWTLHLLWPSLLSAASLRWQSNHCWPDPLLLPYLWPSCQELASSQYLQCGWLEERQASWDLDAHL